MANGIWRIKDGSPTLVLDADDARRHSERHRAVARRAVSVLNALQKMMRYEVKPDGSLGAGSCSPKALASATA